MSHNVTLHAETRADLGKGSSRRLRRKQEKVPAIVYGNTQPAETVSVLYKDIIKITENESFLSTIIDLKCGEKTTPVLIKALQRHPAKYNITHVDFIRVDLNKPIKVHVPLHFINTQNSVGVKQQGGVFISEIAELEILCLPNNISDHVEIDTQNLKIGEALHVKEIQLPEGVSLASANKEFLETTVARITRQRTEEEIEGTPETEEAEVKEKEKED